ncbi:MAG: RecX family transcriptional regulator [Candidatus Marinimicrobia bacterium]|nr:RecX family transcriptional regulator [Candidatus Neomarinimicrobiota bacterium]
MDKKNEITAIKVPLKRPDRRSLYLDGKFAFSVSEGIFFLHNLNVGDCITQRQMITLKADDDRYKISEAAYRLLGYRQRSVSELRTRLLQKGWESDEIEPVIKELYDKGYLDDLEFARMYTRDKIKLKYLGPVALRNELFRTGVDKEIIEKVIDEAYSSKSPRELMLELLLKKRISLDKPMENKEKIRLVNLLKRKGYRWEDIEPVISVIKTR